MGIDRHRRKCLRRWLCVCGRRWRVCVLRRRDALFRTQDGSEKPQRWAMWTVNGGVG